MRALWEILRDAQHLATTSGDELLAAQIAWWRSQLLEPAGPTPEVPAPPENA